MTTPDRSAKVAQRLPFLDTLLYLLAGSAMTMGSVTFFAWLGA